MLMLVIQLQAKLASAQVTSSTRTPSRSKLISSSSSSSHLVASSSAVRVAVMKDANRSSKRSDTTDDNDNDDGDDDVNAMRAVVAMAEDIQLPVVVEQFFLDQIETLVSTTIKLHPVGAILDEASTRLLLKLIMRDVASTARLSFVSIIQHRIGLHEVFGSSAEVFEVFEGIQLEHLSTIDWFSDAVELAVKSVVGKNGSTNSSRSNISSSSSSSSAWIEYALLLLHLSIASTDHHSFIRSIDQWITISLFFMCIYVYLQSTRKSWL